MAPNQNPGFSATTTVKLTAPPEKPTALQQIQVGFMQAGVDSGNAQYPAPPAPPAPPVVHNRQITVPTTTTIDWLTGLVKGPTDEWPWYDANSKDTGTGSGTWARTLIMTDSPETFFPAQFNPTNPGVPDATSPITTGHDTLAFVTCIAARTLDPALQANALYFDHGHSPWATNFVFPMVPNVSIVTFPAPQVWTFPTQPRALPVNVVPTSINHNNPYLRWIPAKYIDYTPDVTSDDFWDAHEVSVVRVESVEGDPAEDGRIRTHVIRRLNARASRLEESYALRDMWFTPGPRERLRVQAGDTLVLYLGPKPPIVARRITPPVEESALVQRLERIASLRRGEGGEEALRESTLHEDPAVAQYALKRLLESPQIAVPDARLTQLRQARDEESTDAVTRLLTAELAFRHAGKDFESDEAYQWLQDSVTNTTASDWTQIAPFVRRLVGIDRRRGEAVAFLTKLAMDEDAREPVRIAAYGGFEPLIYDVSPQEAEQIIDACLQMLHSQNATIREAGATLLRNFGVRGGPGPLEGLAPRAAEALRSAQQGEADDEVRNRLEWLAEQLSNRSGG